MPIKVYDAAETATHLATLESQLAFVLDNGNVDTNIQAHMACSGVNTLSRFAHLAEDIPDLKKVLSEELGLKASDSMAIRLQITDIVDSWTNAKAMVTKRAEIVADARVNESALSVLKGDHKVMLKAYEAKWGKMPRVEVPGRYFLGTKIEEVIENDPKPELLTEVACKQDHESELWTPVFGEDGRVKTRKGSLTKVPPPRDGDELRLRHRLIANAWIMVHLNHTNRPWLAKVTPKTWADFTDFIMGEYVAKYQVDLPNGSKSPLPAWDTVLHFEYQLRKAAYEKISEGMNMEVALVTVMGDGNIRQLHFTTPCQFALGIRANNQMGGQNDHYRRQQFPALMDGEVAANNIRNVFQKPNKNKNGKGKGRGGANKGGKGNQDKGNGGRGQRTTHMGGKASSKKNGRGVCYAYNNGNPCDGQCGFLHTCQKCGGDHAKVSPLCPQNKKD